MGLRVPPKKSIFDLERERTRTEAQRAQRAGSEALQRRQAQLGGGPSGAFLKQEQLLRQDVAKAEAGQRAQIGALEAQEAERKAQVERQREFAREERVGQQQFAGEQARLVREQQERQFGQQFGLQQRAQRAGERQFEQQFGLQERLGLRELSLQEAQQALDAEVRRGTLTLQEAQQTFKEKQFEDDLKFRRDELTQQSNQFMDTLAQRGLLQDAQIASIQSASDLANSAFIHTQEQDHMESIINSTTNALGMFDQLMASGRLTRGEIDNVLKNLNIVVQEDGTLGPAVIQTAATTQTQTPTRLPIFTDEEARE